MNEDIVEIEKDLLIDIKNFLKEVKNTDTGTGSYLEDMASELLEKLK